ncbi:MAG: SPOR domain-containing protein [Oculatellaceae cyanobacterium bins.114]|nr:SPOR domain-containing protein [Oculatellaceae cyanobacterium bins.114]
MRRRASAEPSSRSEQFLHPVLQAALESLDVGLDEELTRYRRMRGRKPGQIERKQRDRQPDTIVIGASSAAHLPSDATLATSASHADGSLPIPPLAIAADPLSDPFADYGLQSSLTPFNPETGQPLTEHQSEEGEPDNYLASSEELLKSIAEEEDLRAEQEPGMLESLLTPLGIGSMLLLLLSSITFGYLIMNPNSISVLGIDKLFGDRTATSNQSQDAATTTANAPAAVLPSPNLADQEFRDLNLDTLSTLPTGESAPAGVVGSTVAPSVSPGAAPATLPDPSPVANLEQRQVATASSTGPSQRPQASGSVPANRQRSDVRQPSRTNSTAARQATATRPTTPAPVRSTAAVSSPRAASPAPAVATAPTSSSQGNLYHVVTEYSGDRSLEQVRQVAGDAFLRNTNEGARVQVGAFSEQSRAEELVQDLQQQGISARIERR